MNNDSQSIDSQNNDSQNASEQFAQSQHKSNHSSVERSSNKNSSTEETLTKILQQVLKQQKDDKPSWASKFVRQVVMFFVYVFLLIPVGFVIFAVIIIQIFSYIVSSFNPFEEGTSVVADVNVPNHTALIKITDPIVNSSDTASAEVINSAIREAFSNNNATGLILYIDSPGGSPTQASLIYDTIVSERENRSGFPVIAVIGDVGTSGAYYIASSADQIYANKYSLVGSIGVIWNNFDVSELMSDLGIKRRTHTAGLYKGIGDPTKAETDFESHFIDSLLDRVHLSFIEDVKKGRGSRIKADENAEDIIFSGLFWDGVTARELGLIDEFGDVTYVANNVIIAPEIIDYLPEDELTSIFRNIGVQILSPEKLYTYFMPKPLLLPQ